MKTLLLHRDAPPKPPRGAACNGCGVCCAARPCPVSLLLFRQDKKGAPCAALQWQTDKMRYVCGLLTEPCSLLPWLPACLGHPAAACFRRSIAADTGCDCDIELA